MRWLTLALVVFLWLAPALAARCTGADPCKACSNCSSCAHCNAGGSCGVCKTRPAPSATDQVKQRCQATTKKGTQCKRSARAGSSYCWQHQP